MTTRPKLSYFFAATLGNLFEHYDKFLFAFLAPFLAPIFFHERSSLSSLVFMFGIMPLGLVSRPLGALVFGKIGDQEGRKKALTLTLFGMAVVTCIMGFLPTYEQAGWISPLLLALTRLIQNFFAAGEITGGALLILENCPLKKRSFFSSLYDASSVLGILIASFAVSWLAKSGKIETHWRLLYFAGAFTATAGIGLRLFMKHSSSQTDKFSQTSLFWLVLKEKRTLLILCLGLGFSYAIYETATTLMNGYLPFVSELTKVESITLGTWILILDLLLLPFFGYLSMRISYQKTMKFFLILTILSSPLLFSLLEHANEPTSFWIRTCFVIFGVGFSAPLYAWAVDLVPVKIRYTLISLATAISAHLFGEGTSFCSLWLFKLTGWVSLPGFFLSVFGLITFVVIVRSSQAKQRPITE
jgi:MHS family proline/betaine transporter-like MFS transporter